MQGIGFLSSLLISELHKRNILVLYQVRNLEYPFEGYWLSVEQLNFPSEVVDEWRKFILSLSQVGIFLEDRGDKIVWEHNINSREVTTKLAYSVIVEEKVA